MLEKGLSSSQLPTADHAKQYCDFMQRNVMGPFDLCDNLMGALTDQAKTFAETAMKAMTGAFTPKR